MSLDIFSKNLKYLRTRMGLSQQALVRKIKVPPGMKPIYRGRYGAWEEGRAYPSTNVLPYLCAALNYYDVITLLTKDLTTVPAEHLQLKIPSEVKAVAEEIRDLTQKILDR